MEGKQEAPQDNPKIMGIETDPRSGRPTGTVTFLFTDIEGSTKMWEQNPQVMAVSFAFQEMVMRKAMAAHSGYVYKMIGDAFQVAFSSAHQALAAAIEAQQRLFAASWPEGGELKVRMSLHTGITDERADDYVGPTLNRAARVLAAGYGGQILLNQTTFALLQERLQAGVDLQDLGTHYLKDLSQPEHLYQVVTSDLPSQFPPLKTLDTARVNLPATTTEFFGREQELASIASLLENPRCRMITLTGTGGCGKTRLAIQAASTATKFVDGVFFVDLSRVNDDYGLVYAIADALGLSFLRHERIESSIPQIQDQLLSYLTGKNILLVLDNFEHLIPQAHLIDQIMRVSDRIVLLITSRERLHRQAEWIVPIQGLAYPQSEMEEGVYERPAAQLFINTAQRAGIPLDIIAERQSIVRICQYIEGNSLAVEMAASWLGVMSCRDIADAIQRDIEFLSAQWKELPERHQSLRAVFDYSWALLSEEERSVAAQLSYFHGPFRRETAMAVTQTSTPMLMALIDKSILRFNTDNRYAFHPMLKQFAREKLTEGPAVHNDVKVRHAEYFCQWMLGLFQQLKGQNFLTALEKIREDIQDVLTAYDYLIGNHEYNLLRESLAALSLFYEMADARLSLRDMVLLLEKLMKELAINAQPEANLPTPPQFLDLYTFSAVYHRRFSWRAGLNLPDLPSRSMILEWAQLLPDGLLKAYSILVSCIGVDSELEPHGLQLCQQCIRLFDQFGDEWDSGMAFLIGADGEIFGRQQTGIADRYYQQSLAKFTSVGNDWGRAMCLIGLAELNRLKGNLRVALQMAQESIDILSRMHDMERLLTSRLILGSTLEDMKAYEKAREQFEANLSYLTEVGNTSACQRYRERLDILDEKIASDRQPR